MLGVLGINVLIQSFLTICIRGAEVQVTLMHDEHVWSTLGAALGSKEQTFYRFIMQPLSSISNVILLFFNFIVHWMFGSALGVDYPRATAMPAPYTAYLTLLWLLFLICTT
jgi:hypothetical protein